MMALTLPTVGADHNTWGTELNAWLMAKHAGVYNVLTYGATGDGVTDDTVAIQAAIDAAADAVLLIPAGRYAGSGIITASSPVTVIAWGAALVGVTLRLLGDYSTVIGLELDGDSYTGGWIDLRGAHQTVAHCYIHETPSNGISCQSGLASYSRIIGNVIEDTGAVGVAPETQGSGIYGESPGSIIANNIIRRSRGHGGIFLIDPVDTVITSNVIEDTAWRGINFYSLLDEGEGIVVSSNIIRRAGSHNSGSSGVGCNGIYANGIVTDPAELLITGNVVDMVAENGIEATNATITNNIVRNTGAYPSLTTPSTEGIWSSGRSIVSGNLIIDADLHGIRLYNATTINGIVYTDNTIIDPGDVGIRLQIDTASAVMDEVVIAGNVITSTQETPSASAGISITATNSATITAASVWVTGNVVTGGVPQSAITGVRAWGNSFDTPATANADTSGATLPELETEVNEMKAALRSLGLMGA